MKSAMLIWNPVAGRARADRDISDAMRMLQELDWNIRFEVSQNAEHVTTLAREAVKDGLEVVWVAGGDGTLRRAAAGLVGSATALGVLPTGTANVWAREIGLPSTGRHRAVKSVRKLASGQVCAMDTGLCLGQPFLFWAGFGLDGRVTERLERKRSKWVKRWNEFYYMMTILQCSARWPGTYMQLETESAQIEGRFMLAVAGNIRYYAGGVARLSPGAEWDDGRMEFWLFSGGKQGGIGRLIRHLWNLGWGRHTTDHAVASVRFQRLSLKFESAEWMQMDGDPQGQVKEASMIVQPQALNVLVPTGARKLRH